MKWKDLVKISSNEIQEYPLVRCVSLGHWTNPVFELFAKPGDTVPIHAHIYIEKDSQGSTAKRIIERFPETIKTYSLESAKIPVVHTYTCTECNHVSTTAYWYCGDDYGYCVKCDCVVRDSS